MSERESWNNWLDKQDEIAEQIRVTLGDTLIVRYHSHEWAALVESGWVTKQVYADGTAELVRS